MKKEVALRFKSLFEEQRRSLAQSKRVIDENFMVPQEDLSDETDLTSSELEASMHMRLRNRETLFSRKIEEALQRIQAGSFGECEDCGEDIELKRLEARPTATLCLGCKEESERRELVHIDGHRHKSVGAKLRLASSL